MHGQTLLFIGALLAASTLALGAQGRNPGGGRGNAPADLNPGAGTGTVINKGAAAGRNVHSVPDGDPSTGLLLVIAGIGLGALALKGRPVQS